MFGINGDLQRTVQRYRRCFVFIGSRRTCRGVAQLSSWGPFAVIVRSKTDLLAASSDRPADLVALWILRFRCKICLSGFSTAPPRSRRAAEGHNQNTVQVRVVTTL